MISTPLVDTDKMVIMKQQLFCVFTFENKVMFAGGLSVYLPSVS